MYTVDSERDPGHRSVNLSFKNEDCTGRPGELTRVTPSQANQYLFVTFQASTISGTNYVYSRRLERTDAVLDQLPNVQERRRRTAKKDRTKYE